MKRISLLIADADERHIQRVTRVLNACQDIELTCAVTDGYDALNEIDLRRPDVVLCDILLPGLDGLTLLKDLQGRAKAPNTIICTRFYSDDVIEMARRYGANYLMYKPIDYHRIPEIVRACCRPAKSVNGDIAATDGASLYDADALRNLLCALGIPANLSGSLYLTEILLCMDADAELMRNLSKGVYDRIAARLSTTPQRIERAIRTAISVACERGSIREIFNHKPTNREFIQYLIQQAGRLPDDANEQH